MLLGLPSLCQILILLIRSALCIVSWRNRLLLCIWREKSSACVILLWVATSTPPICWVLCSFETVCFMRVYLMVETSCQIVSCSDSWHEYLHQTMSFMSQFKSPSSSSSSSSSTRFRLVQRCFLLRILFIWVKPVCHASSVASSSSTLFATFARCDGYLHLVIARWATWALVRLLASVLFRRGWILVQSSRLCATTLRVRCLMCVMVPTGSFIA